MPLIHNKEYIDYSQFGGEPDTVWCAKLIMVLSIDSPRTLNLIQDLGIDPLQNNIKAIDFGDGMGIHYIINNDLNVDYEFKNNKNNKYNITLYSDDDKIIYYPIEKDNLKTSGIKFNYNPVEKPVRKYTKRQIIANNYRIPSITPHKAEDVFYMYVGQDLVFGSLVNVTDLIYEIEITDPTKDIRLINPLSHPRFSWERLKNHVDISWGDGYITKWLDFYINSGRFNRDIGYKLEHKYKNCKVGDKFTIRIRSKEPLTPINCKVTKIGGEFPIDNYLVKDSKHGNTIVGLFGPCNHNDYPEISLLTQHRSTITYLGKDLCKNFLNTTMEREFENFTALTRIEEGFFDNIVSKVKSYKQCFKNNRSLVTKPKGLIGYVNNIVTDIDEMFMDCGSLTNSLNLRVSKSLVSAKNVYTNDSKLVEFDKDFLYECNQLRFINELCKNANSLEQLDVNQFLLSENIEEMPHAFYNTKIHNSCTLRNKHKLWNIDHAFGYTSRYGNLTVIPDNSFDGVGTQASQPVNIDGLFTYQGSTTGLIIPTALFSPLKNTKDIKKITYDIFSNCNLKGTDIPSDIFRDVWNTNKPQSDYALINCFGGIHTDTNILEIRNKQFAGDNTKLVDLSKHLSGDYHIDYLSKDYLNELPNLIKVSEFFSGIKMNCIIPEDFLINQRKINDVSNMFYNVNYKFNHFPLDYLIHTDSNTLNLTNMFKGSNIRTYRLIHWDSNKNINITTTNMVDTNTQTVPISYIIDGRTNANNEIAYKPSTIEFHFICAKNSELTMDIKGAIVEPLTVDWGDGTVETINTNNAKHITPKEEFIVKVTGRNSVYFYINGGSLDCQEVVGEFPYNSEAYVMNGIRNHHYIDPVWHIAKDYGILNSASNGYYHPHYYKHATRLTRIPNNMYMDISGIPSKFYYHCQGLNTLKNALNYNILMLPKNVFPEKLSYSTSFNPEFFLGYLDNDNINRNKVHIFKDILEKDYMNYTDFPFGSSYITIPWNSTIKTFEKVNEPMYEYLGFVIRESANNLGLERLINDNKPIGKIKIEIRTSTQFINKEVTINNDNELNNILGNITVEPNTYGVIKIYSAIPLWLNNHNIIDELRGVIPECNLNKVMKDLAPNLSYTSETIFMRLLNTSFRRMMADLPKYRFIHRNLFLCNINANDFESCFENDTGLYMIPDFLVSAKDYDVNCKRMFKGCNNIDYVYRPICDSVRGRIEVDEMFNGVKTVCFNDSDIDSQVFNKLWYKGTSGLVLTNISSGLTRATVGHPTTYGYTNDVKGAEACKVSTYVNGPNQIDFINKGEYDCLKYLAYKSRFLLSGEDVIHKANKHTEYFAKALKYLPNVTRIDFSDESWFTQDSNAGEKVYQTFDPNLFMYQEKLHTITNAYSNTVVNTPIDNTFLVFNESINSIKGFLRNSGMKDKNTIDRSAILGYNHLGYAFLGAEGIRIPLELGSAFFNSNMECMNDLTDSFRNLWGDFNKDTWIIGKCHPLHFNGTFAVDSDKLNVKRIGVPLTDNLVKNIWNINSDPTKSARFNAYVEFIDTFKGNPHVTDDKSFINRVLSVAAYKPGGIVRGVYENTPLRTYNINTFNNGYYPEGVSFENVYKNTKITELPVINGINNSKSFKGMVSECRNIRQVIPADYIDVNSENCDLTDMFAGSSNLKVTRDFVNGSSKATYNIKNSLEDVVSAIGGDSIIYGNVDYINESNVFNVDNMMSVDERDVFTQSIDVSVGNTTIYNNMIETLENIDLSTYIIKDKLQIDWGDKDTITVGKGNIISETDLEHTYLEAGLYYVRFYLDGKTLFINTNKTKNVTTTSISEFCSDDILNIVDGIDNFSLYKYFGNELTFISDMPFKYIKNRELITSLPLFKNQKYLAYEPFILDDTFKSLFNLTSYYENCPALSMIDPSIIPLSVRNKITVIDYMYSKTGIMDNTSLLDGYDNIISAKYTFKDCKDLSTFDVNILENRTHLRFVDGFIQGCKNIHINNTFNTLFHSCGVNIDQMYDTFIDVPIDEFPSDIFKYLPNILVIKRVFELTDINIEDNEFELNKDVFKYNTKLKELDSVFRGRYNLKHYDKALLHSSKELVDIEELFAYTGIREIYNDTIISNTNIKCNGLFKGTYPKYIEAGIIKQNDTRIVNITDMLLGVKGQLTEKEVIGNIKSTGNSGYKQLTHRYEITPKNKTRVILIPEDESIVYPIHGNYDIEINNKFYTINKVIKNKSEFINLFNFTSDKLINKVIITSINSPKLICL